MNFWGFQRSFLQEAQERFPLLLRRALARHPEKGEVQLPVMVADMLDRGRAQVRVLSSGEKWFGVTYREDKPSVVAALREKTEDATVIIVAQRISTILHADRIIVLDEGRIAGMGTHGQLLRDCEAYREIARSQLSEAELKGGAAV